MRGEFFGLETGTIGYSAIPNTDADCLATNQSVNYARFFLNLIPKAFGTHRFWGIFPIFMILVATKTYDKPRFDESIGVTH